MAKAKKTVAEIKEQIKEMKNCGISMYLHCGKCLEEWKNNPNINTNQSPTEYSQLEVGYTKWGIQIWCRRHNLNVLHVDFEGVKHPGV